MRLRLNWITLFSALLLSGTVFAQGGFGLDLSDEEPQKPEAAKPPPAANPPRIALPPLESEGPRPPSAEFSEKEIAAEDRVKSVQRKPFLKRRRLELTPMAFLTVNDAFFPKFGPSGRVAYHLHDSFGLGLRYLRYSTVQHDNVRLAKRQLQSRLPSVKPLHSFHLDALWTPIYGKVSLFNSIKSFDLYVVGGVGGVISQRSFADSINDGVLLSTHIGVGQRFAITDFMTIDLSAIEAIYTDTPGSKSVVQHVLSVQGGVSLFIPPSFD